MHLSDGYKSSLRDDFVVGEMSSLMASGEVIFLIIFFNFC